MKQKAQPPKNIIISHVYSSDNKGDAALTSVLIQDLKRRFSGAAITILKLEVNKRDDQFEGVPERPSFMYYALNQYKNLLVKLAFTLYMISATLLWAVCRKRGWPAVYLPKNLRDVAEIYEQADLIVPVGGGYLRSRKGLLNRFNLPLLLHPLLFGYLLGKPTVLYSQSVGPFQNGFERLIVAYVLKRMTRILLREDTSMALLASLGVIDNTARAIDSGFLLRSNRKLNMRKLYGIAPDALLVGATVRAWLKGDAQAKYEAAVAKALDAIIETQGAHVVFIPQVTAIKGDDDRLVSRRVHGLMRHTKAVTRIDDTPDHHRIKAIYDNLDILLGTRFHSVIFSLTSYVPVLAIEYEHKTSGIMRDLDLEQWVVKIEDVNARQLTKMLKTLVEQQGYYRAHLYEYLPPYMELARDTITILEKSYFMAMQKARQLPSSRSSELNRQVEHRG